MSYPESFPSTTSKPVTNDGILAVRQVRITQVENGYVVKVGTGKQYVFADLTGVYEHVTGYYQGRVIREKP